MLLVCKQPEYMVGFSINQISTVNLVSSNTCPVGCSCFQNGLNTIVDCSNTGFKKIKGKKLAVFLTKQMCCLKFLSITIANIICKLNTT